MFRNALETVQELLNEEKWTRAAIENYSRKNFIHLDNIISDSIKEGNQEELLEICKEHHRHCSHSIISLYIMGILKYERKDLDDRDINEAITLFRDNKKWTIVQFLAERILDYGESSRALKHLASVYQHLNLEDEVWKTRERLVKIDHDNYEVARKIAAHYEEENKELAIYYYQITLRRILQQQSFSQLDIVWKKLVDLDPEDLDFFLSIESRLKGKMNDSSIGNLYMDLVPFYEEKDIDTAIQLLELVTSFSPSNENAREHLITCFRIKYEKHSLLESTVEKSGLENPETPLKDALQMFYKHIAFDSGDYVFHRSWKIGRITEITEDNFTIDFDCRKRHKMNIEMAIKSLTRLPEAHLWIQARNNLDELKDMAENDIEEFLRITLSSFEKKMVLKDLKEEILKHKILPASRWSSWWNKAKRIFKTNPKFGTSPDRKNIYFLRDKPMTLEEDSFNRFEAEKEFSKKLLIFEDFLNHTSGYNSLEFTTMVNWFVSRIDGKINSVDATVLETVLFLLRLKKQTSSRPDSIEVNVPELSDIYPFIKDPAALFNELIESENKKAFLQYIRKSCEDWDSVYLQILQLPTGQYHARLFDELTLNDRGNHINEFISTILDHYRDDSDHLTWLAKIYFEREERDDPLEVNKATLITALINSMSRLHKDIENKTNVAVNRKRFNFIKDCLFKEERLARFIEKSERAAVEKVIRLVSQVSELVEEQDLQAIGKALSQNHEGLKLSFGAEKVESGQIHPFLVTARSVAERQQEYKKIMDVEFPKNSQEIALAVEKGDLSENAEYKAALEHQEQLKARIAQLDEELKIARIVEAQDVAIDHVSFGTRVRLSNRDKNTEEELTILGEWESNPEVSIISYKSPLGNALLFKKTGEEFLFEAGGNSSNYKILDIQRANLD